MLDIGARAQPIDDGFQIDEEAFGYAEVRVRRREVDQHQPFGREAGIDRVEPAGRAEQQAGGDERNHGHARLEGDHCVAPPASSGDGPERAIMEQ